MSWLSESWTDRAPVAVDNTAGTTGTADVQITVPVDWDDFWTSVQSDGDDVRLTASDGRTLLTYQLSSWTYATRTAVLQVDGLAVTGSTMAQIWLYWGNASATSAGSSFTASSPLTGSICIESPRGFRVQVEPPTLGQLRPTAQAQKASSEVSTIWWDWRSMLSGREEPYEGSRTYEEIDRVSLTQVDDDGVAQAGMVAAAGTVLLDGWVGTVIQAGTSGSDYTAICRVVTTRGRTLEGRALVKVYNLAE